VEEAELALLRYEQDATVEDLAHAYPSIAALVEAKMAVEPFADHEGQHELSCRLIAGDVFERHRAHLDALKATRVLDMVGFVASKLEGPEPVEDAASSLLDTTVPALRAEITASDDTDLVARERELRDAVALVLAAKSLQNTALDW